MELIKKKIVDLKGNPKNPRKLSDLAEQNLYSSLLEYGNVGLVVIDQDDNIISGHQRVKILKDMGETEVECLVTDFDENKNNQFLLDINSKYGTGRYKGKKLGASTINLEFDTEEDLIKFKMFLAKYENPVNEILKGVLGEM